MVKLFFLFSILFIKRKILVFEPVYQKATFGFEMMQEIIKGGVPLIKTNMAKISLRKCVRHFL